MPDRAKDSLLGKIAAYTEILSTDPRSTIFVSLSETYRKMGMLEDAYGVAVKGLEHLPDYAPGHVVLARIKCQQGDYSGSETSFAQALEFDPDSLAALVGFSRLSLLQDNHSAARELLLKARELSPADPVINKLLLGLPEEEAAPIVADEESVVPEQLNVDAEETAPPTDAPEPLQSATLAELYLKQGMADRARDIYQNLLSKDPDNLELRRRIRDLDIASGNTPAPLQEEAPAAVVAETAAAVEVPTDENDSDSSPMTDLPVIDQLHRLLDSIQKRRGDV